MSTKTGIAGLCVVGAVGAFMLFGQLDAPGIRGLLLLFTGGIGVSQFRIAELEKRVKELCLGF